MGYNSQFDVEREVEHAAELIENDLDFGGWIRDIPELDAET